MGQFTFFAVLLGCLAVAFAISALWQKSRALALVLALALPLAAGALYWSKGQPAALDPANTQPPKTIDEAIGQLQRLTEADPKNFSDQATLARAYMAKQQYPEAEAAYAKALALKPDETVIYVEYAEAMLRNSPDRKFPPQALHLIERALAADPQNQRALFFLGLQQRMSGHPAQAAETWERLLALLDPTAAVELRHQIGTARQEAGLPPIGPSTATVSVTVRLDPTLAREAAPGAVLYVFARTPDGKGPPVAVKRIAPEHFPVQVELGDMDSPMPTATLSQQAQVLIAARLSKSGDAKAASGDLEADPATVKVEAGAKVEVTLNRSVP